MSTYKIILDSDAEWHHSKEDGNDVIHVKSRQMPQISSISRITIESESKLDHISESSRGDISPRRSQSSIRESYMSPSKRSMSPSGMNNSGMGSSSRNGENLSYKRRSPIREDYMSPVRSSRGAEPSSSMRSMDSRETGFSNSMDSRGSRGTGFSSSMDSRGSRGTESNSSMRSAGSKASMTDFTRLSDYDESPERMSYSGSSARRTPQKSSFERNSDLRMSPRRINFSDEEMLGSPSPNISNGVTRSIIRSRSSSPRRLSGWNNEDEDFKEYIVENDPYSNTISVSPRK